MKKPRWKWKGDKLYHGEYWLAEVRHVDQSCEWYWVSYNMQNRESTSLGRGTVKSMQSEEF
jgi:hypothetical protein